MHLTLKMETTKPAGTTMSSRSKREVHQPPQIFRLS
jgi:hypothetical protein